MHRLRILLDYIFVLDIGYRATFNYEDLQTTFPNFALSSLCSRSFHYGNVAVNLDPTSNMT